MLLDVADYQLYFEIVGMLLGDFIESEKNRLETCQLRDFFDLLVQSLQFIEGIQVFRVHDCYPTLAL
jgi:hypothetical protein